MKTIQIILIAIIILFFYNCKKEPSKAAVRSMFVDISYKDKMGNDLLDATTPNYFSSGSIHVYNLVNGIKKEVFYAYQDYPQNFMIYKNNERKSYYLRLFTETDTTLLELNKFITDTVVGLSEKSLDSWLLKKVWYNGGLVWNNVGVEEFTIVK